MEDKKDVKEKTKNIYGVLPKLDDQRCGYKTCRQFARAVAEGKAPCHGCVSGGLKVASKVCEMTGARVPEGAIPQFGQNPAFYRRGVRGDRWIATGIGRGIGRGQRMGRGRGLGRGSGMSRESGRGPGTL